VLHSRVRAHLGAGHLESALTPARTRDRPVRMRAERLLSQQLQPSSGANVIAADLRKAQGVHGALTSPGARLAAHLPRPRPVTTRTGQIGPAQLAAMRYACPPTVCCQGPASEARSQRLHGRAGDGSRCEARAQSECPRMMLPTAHNWRICCGRRDQSIASDHPCIKRYACPGRGRRCRALIVTCHRAIRAGG
jgi:hypothetical protein